MSYKSLIAATRDTGLVDRTIAAVQQEARAAPPGGADYAALVVANPAEGVQLVWPVALNTEAEYESALASGVDHPGNDESVITDGMILSAIQTSWPPDAP